MGVCICKLYGIHIYIYMYKDTAGLFRAVLLAAELHQLLDSDSPCAGRLGFLSG